jgi:hypothetical protein
MIIGADSLLARESALCHNRKVPFDEESVKKQCSKCISVFFDLNDVRQLFLSSAGKGGAAAILYDSVRREGLCGKKRQRYCVWYLL